MEKAIIKMEKGKMTRYGKLRTVMQVEGEPPDKVYWLYQKQYDILRLLFGDYAESTKERVVLGTFDDKKGYFKYAKLVYNAECFFETPPDQDLSDLFEEVN